MSVKRDNETPTIPAILEDLGRTASAFQVACALYAVADKAGNVRWVAVVGDLSSRSDTPQGAYTEVLRRLATINNVLGSKFAAQMDQARARGAKEKQ